MKLLTINEVAEKLRLKKSTIYKMVFNRKIPFLKFSGRVFFDEDEVENWVKDSTIRPVK